VLRNDHCHQINVATTTLYMYDWYCEPHVAALRVNISLTIFYVKRQFINETLFGLANLYSEYLCFMCFIPGVFQQFEKIELIRKYKTHLP
jgi:hypothetical protein